MKSVKSFAKMRKHELWFLVTMMVFLANASVMLFCHHIATNHHATMHVDTTNDADIVTDALSSYLVGGKGDDDLPVFAICLLTRDDLPILPEWIAYHYHAVNLRHLVVGVDPISATDPKPIFDDFRKYLGNDANGKDGLIIEQWSEADFMPKYFVDGEHGKAPNFVGGKGNPDTETWEEWYTREKHFGPRKRRDQTLINSHRYRQTRFLARCSEHLRDTYTDSGTPTTVWMSTLDSDEFMAANPWIMADRPVVPKSVLRFERGAVLRWIVDYEKQKEKQPTKRKPPIDDETADICVQVPRLLFGAVELSPATAKPAKLADDLAHGIVTNPRTHSDLRLLPRRSNKMETLRWKFHAAPDDERNFQQKVILDLHRVPKDDELWGDHVHTVHRPSRTLCAPETDNNLNGTLLVPSDDSNTASPVVAFHYIGSEERYFSRPDDFRRNPKKYRERSNITHARDETGWIDQWLEQFVKDVGIATASKLLSSYVVQQK
mmetsp:Transcript_16909/g.39053  ORF Transcript_16909/g.39053 Transcript_16909/m.39053 type:complete len:491 (-) Transcript_16909:458-1930(-)